MRDGLVISVEKVSKKFCRSLKRSILYGVQDITRDTFGIQPGNDRLRKGEFWAIDNVSFEVRRGECLGLMGPNGAGKSTLLKLISGLILPDKGKISVRGRVSTLLEIGAGFHPMLTGRENIHITGAIIGLTKEEIDRKIDEIVAFAELEEFIDSPVKFYSNGMYARLSFSVTIHADPDILLVDEALAVGDIFFQHKCYDKIKTLVGKGSTVFFVSHDVSSIKAVCQKALLLDHGTLVGEGLSAEIADLYQRMRFEVPSPEDVKQSNYAGQSQAILKPLFSKQGFPLTDEEFAAQVKGRDYGTREAIIANVGIYSKDGIVKKEFSFDEEIDIRVKLLAMTDVQRYVLGFLLRDRAGLNLLGINTHEEKVAIIPMRAYDEVLIEFSTKLPFCPGTYSIALGLSYDGAGTKFMHWIDHAAFIHINEPMVTIHGAVYLPTNIHLRLL